MRGRVGVRRCGSRWRPVRRRRRDRVERRRARVARCTGRTRLPVHHLLVRSFVPRMQRASACPATTPPGPEPREPSQPQQDRNEKVQSVPDRAVQREEPQRGEVGQRADEVALAPAREAGPRRAGGVQRGRRDVGRVAEMRVRRVVRRLSAALSASVQPLRSLQRTPTHQQFEVDRFTLANRVRRCERFKTPTRPIRRPFPRRKARAAPRRGPRARRRRRRR